SITVRVPGVLIMIPGTFGVTVTAKGATSNAIGFQVGSPNVSMTINPAGPLTFDALGLTQTLAATATTAGGTVVPTDFKWASSNSGVVTVRNDGVLETVGNGAATISATAEGLFGSVAVTVQQVANSVALSPSTTSITSLGGTAQFSAA